MREPMPEVSSSTQPSGALTMNRWLSPSITSAFFVPVSCGAAVAAAGFGALAAAGAERATGDIAASAQAAIRSAVASQPRVGYPPNAGAGADVSLSGRGSALSGDLRTVADGFAKTNGVMDECTPQRMPSLRAFCTTARFARTSGPDCRSIDSFGGLGDRRPRMDAQRVIARRMVTGIPPDGLSPAWEKD